MQRIKPSVSRNGNGIRLVDAIHVSRLKELRAYVEYKNWKPDAVSFKMHWNKRGRRQRPAGDIGFNPISIPLRHVTDLQVLLSRAYECALSTNPPRGGPYAED